MKAKQISITPTILCLLVLFTLFSFSRPAMAQGSGADALVKKAVAALGGEKAIQAFADYEAEGDVKVTYFGRELAGTIKMVQKGPKRYQKVKMTFGSREFLVIEAYDGKVTWRDMMGTLADQPSLNHQSDLDHTVDLLIKKGVKFTMGKETEIDGKKAVSIVAESNGKKTTFFLDKTDSTILEIVFKDLYFGQKQVKESMEKRIRYQDYRKKDGLMFPYTSIYYLKGKKSVELNYKTITFNPKVLATLFQRPDKAPDLRFRAERYE